MLIVETVARIRREFFVKGKSIKEIVRDLGVSRNTLRTLLKRHGLLADASRDEYEDSFNLPI